MSQAEQRWICLHGKPCKNLQDFGLWYLHNKKKRGELVSYFFILCKTVSKKEYTMTGLTVQEKKRKNILSLKRWMACIQSRRKS